MSYNYANSKSIVADADSYERAWFIQRTYMHVAGAILGFAVLCYILINSPLCIPLIKFTFSSSISQLIVFGGFIFVSVIAEKWALNSASREKQYMGLALYVFAEAIIFMPILYLAAYYAADKHLIAKAGVTTLLLFTALTVMAFTSKVDFSFLGKFLTIGGFVAMGVILSGILFGFNLGTWFSGGMVIFAGGCILYHTSNVMRVYRTDQYVAASLAIFASVALMFWYILQIFMSARD